MAPTSASPETSLHQWLSHHPEVRTIAIYSPLAGEIDLSGTVRRHPDLKWVFPKVCGDELTFHTGENLRPGAFGILEPAAGSPEVPITHIDAFVCPGLAFDPKGGRLGRGRGFYDRMLSNIQPGAWKIGICWSFQIVPDTFPESHDIPMNLVISEDDS